MSDLSLQQAIDIQPRRRKLERSRKTAHPRTGNNDAARTREAQSFGGHGSVLSVMGN